jgi:hypothetical protein
MGDQSPHTVLLAVTLVALACGCIMAVRNGAAAAAAAHAASPAVPADEAFFAIESFAERDVCDLPFKAAVIALGIAAKYKQRSKRPAIIRNSLRGFYPGIGHVKTARGLTQAKILSKYGKPGSAVLWKALSTIKGLKKGSKEYEDLNSARPAFGITHMLLNRNKDQVNQFKRDIKARGVQAHELDRHCAYALTMLDALITEKSESGFWQTLRMTTCSGELPK